jgi:4-amino-4-deoxy-L-arabinose transferase-like glycosyltransferase
VRALVREEPLAGKVCLSTVVAVGAMALAIWLSAYHLRFSALAYPDACDYAQLGRQIQRGEGLSSLQSFPYVLAWLGAHGYDTAPPWPNVTRFVLPPLLQALSFSVFGVSDLAALAPNLSFFVLSAMVAFLLGNRLFGPLAGLLASTLLVTGPTALRYGMSALSEAGAGFFALAGAWVLSGVLRGRRRIILEVALGVLLGLGFLQRLNLAFALAASVLLTTLGPERRPLRVAFQSSATMLGSALLVASPWLFRNALEFGSPLFSLTSHRAIGLGLLDREIFYDFSLISPFDTVAAHLDVVLLRLRGTWLLENWDGLFGTELWWLGPAFLASLLVPLQRPARTVRAYALLTLLLMYALMSTVFSVHRYYHPFAALLLVVVAGGATELLRRLPRRSHAVALGLLSLGALALAGAWVSHDFGSRIRQAEPHQKKLERLVTRVVEEDAVVASDRSWLVAWYCDRRAVRFCGDAGQLAQYDRYVRISAVLLAPRNARKFRKSLSRGEQRGLYREEARLPDGTTLWLRTGQGRELDEHGGLAPQDR